jgi:hypothetical protein
MVHVAPLGWTPSDLCIMVVSAKPSVSTTTLPDHATVMDEDDEEVTIQSPPPNFTSLR